MYVEGAKTLRTNDSFISCFANEPVQIWSIVMGEKIRSLYIIVYDMSNKLRSSAKQTLTGFFQVLPNILQSNQFPHILWFFLCQNV